MGKTQATKKMRKRLKSCVIFSIILQDQTLKVLNFVIKLNFTVKFNEMTNIFYSKTFFFPIAYFHQAKTSKKHDLEEIFPLGLQIWVGGVVNLEPKQFLERFEQTREVERERNR